MEELGQQQCLWTYTVNMMQHMNDDEVSLTFSDDVKAVDELGAITQMKETLFSAGFDAHEISVLSAKRVVDWS